MPVQFVEQWEDYSAGINYPLVNTASLVSNVDSIEFPRNFILDANLHIEENIENIVLRSIEVSDENVVINVESKRSNFKATATGVGPVDLISSSGEYSGCILVGNGYYKVSTLRRKRYTFNKEHTFVPKVLNQSSSGGIKGVRVGNRIFTQDINIVLDRGWEYNNGEFTLVGNPYFERDILYKNLPLGTYLGIPIRSVNQVNNNGQFWFNVSHYDRLRFVLQSRDTIRVFDISDTKRA